MSTLAPGTGRTYHPRQSHEPEPPALTRRRAQGMEEQEIRTTLDSLRTEHRDLDQAILDLHDAGSRDELLLRRLKKRKLVLRDRIATLERLLEPDEFA